jgi:hypothetical protein
MTRKEIKDVAASVRARLLNHARENQIEFNLVLRRYFFERFLYRLSKSDARNRFILKGAMLLRTWSDSPYRATVDLDLLRVGGSDRDAVRDDFLRILDMNVETGDGVRFDSGSLRIEELRASEEYLGFRISVVASLGVARDRLRIDVGVGDATWPRPARIEYPTFLDLPAPQVLAYKPESVVAEKLQAIIRLGLRNSRIKDYFDIDYIASNFEFQGAVLGEAIRRTFERRRTPIRADTPIGLTTEYWQDPRRTAQMRAFAKRARLEPRELNSDQMIERLQGFVVPILRCLSTEEEFHGTWRPGGPWR